MVVYNLIIMNSKYILNLLKNTSSMKNPLGRWNIHNYTQTVLKIKYANEDHCGTCGECEIKENNDDELYIYMMGNESLPDNVNIKK